MPPLNTRAEIQGKLDKLTWYAGTCRSTKSNRRTGAIARLSVQSGCSSYTVCASLTKTNRHRNKLARPDANCEACQDSIVLPRGNTTA